MRSSTPCPTAVHDRAGPSQCCPITEQDCPTTVPLQGRTVRQLSMTRQDCPNNVTNRAGVSHNCPKTGQDCPTAVPRL